jgi:hypothetical protein
MQVNHDFLSLMTFESQALSNRSSLIWIQRSVYDLKSNWQLRRIFRPATSAQRPQMVLTISFKYVYFWYLVSSSVQSRSRKHNVHLQLHNFADQLQAMNHQKIDTQMVFLHAHLLTPTDDLTLQQLVSRIRRG